MHASMHTCMQTCFQFVHERNGRSTLGTCTVLQSVRCCMSPRSSCLPSTSALAPASPPPSTNLQSVVWARGRSPARWPKRTLSNTPNTNKADCASNRHERGTTMGTTAPQCLAIASNAYISNKTFVLPNALRGIAYGGDGLPCCSLRAAASQRSDHSHTRLIPLVWRWSQDRHSLDGCDLDRRHDIAPLRCPCVPPRWLASNKATPTTKHRPGIIWATYHATRRRGGATSHGTPTSPCGCAEHRNPQHMHVAPWERR